MRERAREGERKGIWGKPKYKSVCVSHSHNLQAYESVSRLCSLSFFFFPDYNSSATLTFFFIAWQRRDVLWNKAIFFTLESFRAQA